ncbi:MAG: thiamine pyrophosphate-binding protein [Bacteroidales bacterium]|nr:thiamine pyrophosphate-binding protein [Bacteroidales bacterium]
MTIAQYIASQFHANGVKYVFGIPGGPSIPYIEAFRSSGIEFILTTGEAAAGIMAGVTAKLTGIPGVCHATFGPGATNLATGTGYAFLDRYPVLALTSEMDDIMIERTSQMNINHQKLFAPITKATFRLSGENAEEVIADSLNICQNEYPGPVHIGLPVGLADMESRFTGLKRDFNYGSEAFGDRTEVMRIISNSKKPLLAVGLTAARLGLQPKLIDFLNTRQIPVVITPMAKGILPENHRSYAGVLFHALSSRLDEIISKADLVIGLGYDPVEFNYESWMPDIPLVHFGTRLTDMPVSLRNVQYISDQNQWFDILNSMKSGDQSDSLQSVQAVRKVMESAFLECRGHFGPVTAIRVLQEELPEDAILTADVGSHLHLAGQFWETGGRNNLIMSNGWSGMGFGVPAALAAGIVRKPSAAACITGDGGFLMSAGEILTARRYNIPVKVIVFTDGEFNLIRLKKSWQGLTPYGTMLYSGDLFGADTFFGVKVFRVETEHAMRKAVRESMLTDEPVILNAAIDPADYDKLITKR